MDEIEFLQHNNNNKKIIENKINMEGTPNCLKLHTWARHRAQLLQGAILKGRVCAQRLLYPHSRVREGAIVDHTSKASGLNSFPTVSTL